MRALAARRVSTTPPTTNEGDTSPRDRGAQARELFEQGRFGEAEQLLWEILRTSPAAPTTTYLLGLAVLQRGRVREARRLIDRAYELQPWIDDRVRLPDPLTVLRRAEQDAPDWLWPRYQLRRERWRAIGLTLRSASEHLVVTSPTAPRFVQIGANDGMRGDPLRPVIAELGLRGLFVEPQPEPFEKLRRNYESLDGYQFAQVAVTEEDGPVIMTTATSRTTLGTIDPSRNLMRNRREDVAQIEVRGLTFESLMREYGIERAEIFQIDTEGFDYKILKQIPLGPIGAEVVNMEFFCLPLSERIAAFDHFDAAGFAWFFGGMDLLAVRRATFEDRFCITEVI